MKDNLIRIDENINDFKEDLHERLHKQLKDKIESGLDQTFENYFDDLTINELFGDVDKKVHDEIEAQIEALPSFKYRDIYKSGLSPNMKDEIKTIIKVAKKYENPENDIQVDFNNGEFEWITEKISEIKDELSDKGITVVDVVELPKYKDGDQYFFLDKIPEEINLVSINLNDDNDKIIDYDPDNGIELVNPPEKLEVSVHLKLNVAENKETEKGNEVIDEEKEIDIFSPLEWKWKITQDGMETIEEKEIPGESNNNFSNTSPEKDEDDQPQETPKSDSGENAEVVEDDVNSTDGETSKTDETKLNNDNDAVPEEYDEIPEENGEDNGETEIETTITNNFLYNKVHSSLLDDIKEKDISESVKMAAEFVSEYYKLYSLFDFYYGFMNDEELREKLKENELIDLTTDDSFYHLTHEINIKDMIKNQVKKEI